MPIGLPETSGGRASDREAKKLLGRASSRVFPAPTRACLDAPTYAAARLIQPSLLRPVLRAAHRRSSRSTEARREGPVIEVHPELAFLAFAGRPLASKKTWDGQVQRRQALADQGLAPDDLGPTGGTAAADDVLDAAACALVARAYAAGSAVPLGDEAEGVIWMPAPAR